MDGTEERLYEAELYRLKGELTLNKWSEVQWSSSEVTEPQSLTPNPNRSRSMFPQGHRRRTKAASQIARTPRDDEPALGCGSNKASKDEARKMLVRDLPLVHRRV